MYDERKEARVIAIRDMKKTYAHGDVETTALNHIDLKVKAGEFLAIMGPSGCGKSTLLHILGLLDNANSGEYRFLGEDVSKYSERKRARLRKATIGFVFQSFNLIDDLSVSGNIELPLIYLGLSEHERRRRVLNIMEQMQLIPRKNHYPQQLSGGQQQRVALARALVTNPKLILADEPTGNLDSANGDAVMSLLTDMHEAGTTIVMVTHSPAYAEYARRVVHLFDGQILSENFKGIADAEASWLYRQPVMAANAIL